MTVFFEQSQIDQWIGEDASYLDLTSHMLGLHNQHTTLRYVVRDHIRVAGTEEVAEIVRSCGGQTQPYTPSGVAAMPGQTILLAQGPAKALLRAWKVGQNLLEFACGIVTLTHQVVQAVQTVNASVAVLTTRKHAPGVRKLALKATLSGGAMPHRLGLGETILIFPQHRALMGGWEEVGRAIARHKYALCEKKIVIEAADLDEAYSAAQAGADVVQFDKVPPETLAQIVPALRKAHPNITILAAGGIHAGNAAAYAATGVNALVTSSLHYAKPADIGVKVSLTESTESQEPLVATKMEGLE
ncbi:ModD protein [Alcaligenes faecalis]|uniref:ModD protein n=1 Tax=Alcaligenes faecalis TaxID=511 RepID=UPI0035587416